LSEVGSDVAAWARAHEACFEVAPLVEMVRGRQVQVGFTLSLYARLPLGTGPGPERVAAAAEIWEGLREIAQSLAPREGTRARVEVEGQRAAAFFEPEGRMLPEVAPRPGEPRPWPAIPGMAAAGPRAAPSGRYSSSTGVQVLSGLKRSIDLKAFRVPSPRSFS